MTHPITLSLELLDRGSWGYRFRLTIRNDSAVRLLLPSPDVTGLRFVPAGGGPPADWFTHMFVSATAGTILLDPGTDDVLDWRVRPDAVEQPEMTNGDFDYHRWCVSLTPGPYEVRYEWRVGDDYFDPDSHATIGSLRHWAAEADAVAWQGTAVSNRRTLTHTLRKPSADEAALLAGVAAAPHAALPRLVYADWLDDHDRPVEAELLRLGEHLHAGKGTANDRDWFRALAAARYQDWLAKVVRPEVGRCGLRFRFACPKRWDDMIPTTDPTQRHCEGCQKTVYLCTDRAAAIGWAMAGECVAIDRRLVNRVDVPQDIEVIDSGMIDFEYQPPARLPRQTDPVEVELRYAALSPAWGLVEAARADLDYGSSLAMLPTWFADANLAPGRADEDPDPFWQAACGLAGDHTLAARVLSLGRRFDFLHWLLSATRRGDPPAPDDAVLDRLFSTGSPVAEHVRACQGWSVVHVPAAVVAGAAVALARMTAGDLAKRFDLARADRAGIYKYVAGRDDAGWLEVARRQLGELQRFVTAAAVRGDELIVVVD